MQKRVVVTGFGTVNPLGNSVQEFWKNVKNVENGIAKVSRFDVSDFSSRVAGEVRDFSPEDYIERREIRRLDRFTVYAVISAMEAMKRAGIKEGDVDPERIGVILGNGIGGIETLETAWARLFDKGPMTIYPLTVPKMISNIAPGNIAIKFGAHGPCYSVVSACSSATDALGDAYRLIKDGVVDVMISGGTEAPISQLGLAGFCVLQAVSTKFNDTPEKASRPFDRDRDGFVIAEGAGVLVLEELERAKGRGAMIYAEVAGHGRSCDANHLTAPHPDGVWAAQAMRLAIRSAGMQPEDIDYINAHGTSTPVNDPIETKAIKAVFGEHARKLKVSSTKSMIGHLLGAAGGPEAIVTILAMQEQYFPATRNLENADPECDLDYVPNKGVFGRIRAALSSSFGFGGHNSVILLKRYE